MWEIFDKKPGPLEFPFELKVRFWSVIGSQIEDIDIWCMSYNLYDTSYKILNKKYFYTYIKGRGKSSTPILLDPIHKKTYDVQHMTM